MLDNERAAKTPERGLGDNPYPPLHERVSFLVHQVNGRIGQVCAPEFAELDVDLYTSRILGLLHERETMSVGEVVEVMVLAQSTISHQIQRLEARGLLQRTRSSEDNRSVLLTLTPEGRRLAAECHQLGAKVYRQIVQALDDSEVHQLSDLLRKMLRGMG